MKSGYWKKVSTYLDSLEIEAGLLFELVLHVVDLRATLYKFLPHPQHICCLSLCCGGTSSIGGAPLPFTHFSNKTEYFYLLIIV